MTNIFDYYDLGGAELPNRIVIETLVKALAGTEKALIHTSVPSRKSL
jgi:hypothetical protein